MPGTKKKSGKGKHSKPKQPKAASEAYLEGLQHLTPQEHVAAVKPLWETLSADDRINLLTIPLDDLKTYAKQQAARAKAAADAEAAEALLAGNIVITLEPPVDEVLEVGIERSKERGTWKVWRWPTSLSAEEDSNGEGDDDNTNRDGDNDTTSTNNDNNNTSDGSDTMMKEFYDSEAFRKYLEDVVIPKELRSVIPKEEEGVKAVETPAEAGLRQRMTDLLARVSEQRALQEENGFNRRAQRRHDAAAAVRDANIDLISMMLGAVESEHEALYYHVLRPITTMICEILPEGARKTTLDELHYEDLEHLLPDDIIIIHDWLTEKIDALTTKLKPDQKDLEEEDAEEEPIGDVDLFTLVDDGNAMRVNEKWLSHLQSRVLGEDGQPRRANEGEDPHSLGLVLEWIYGTIVSTAEKARDGAHRALGGKLPCVEQAMELLTSALEEQVMWEKKAEAGKEILEEMQESREQASQLAEEYDMRTGSAWLADQKDSDDGSSDVVDTTTNTTNTTTADLPPEIIIFMLKREALLTTARIHYLVIEQFQSQRTLRSIKSQLLQGEPQFERLKKELEELKAAPTRSLDGTYRSSAEMERARKQLSDASIEDQIQIQASFRETGLRLQKLVDKKKEIEVAVGRREQEIAQLTTWKGTVTKLATSIEAALASSAPLDAVIDDIDEEKGNVSKEEMALLAAVKSATGYGNDLASCCAHFQKDVRKQLYTDADDTAHYDKVKSQLSEIEERMEEGKVAIQLLKGFVINVACDDPGTTLGVQLLLPFLQDKLDAKALEHAAKLAAAAEDEILKMELESADRQRQEKEKKARAKLKAKEKARMDKERERADQEAKEREAKLREEREARQREEEREAERRRREEEMQRLRQLEEEAMERRRQELLEQEGSDWNQRLEEEEFIAAQAQLEKELMKHAMHNKHVNGGVDVMDGFVAAGGHGHKSRSKDTTTAATNGKVNGSNNTKGKSRKRSGKDKNSNNNNHGNSNSSNNDTVVVAAAVADKPQQTTTTTTTTPPPESVSPNNEPAPTPDTPPAADSTAIPPSTAHIPPSSPSNEDTRINQPTSLHTSPIKPSTASTPHGSPAAVLPPPPSMHPGMPPHGVTLPNGVVIPPMPLPMMPMPMPPPHPHGVMHTLPPPPPQQQQQSTTTGGSGGTNDDESVVSRTSSMSNGDDAPQQQQQLPPGVPHMHLPHPPYPTVVGTFHHPNGMLPHHPMMYYPPHPHHHHHHHHHQHHHHPRHHHHHHGVVPPPPPPPTPPPSMLQQQQQQQSNGHASPYPVMPPPPPPPPAMPYGAVPPPAPPRRPRQSSAAALMAKQLRADAQAFIPSSNTTANGTNTTASTTTTTSTTNKEASSPRGILERPSNNNNTTTTVDMNDTGVDSESTSGKSTSSESGSLVTPQEELPIAA